MARPQVKFRGKAVTIACVDQKRSERFYEEVLGAVRLPGEGFGCSWFQLGNVTLNLMPNASEPSSAEFPTDAMHLLWLEVDDLSEAHSYLSERGVSIVEMHEEEFMLIADPDGLLVEVWQSTDEE